MMKLAGRRGLPFFILMKEFIIQTGEKRQFI
jgi:hypothetical protein